MTTKPALLIVDDDDIILLALRESVASEGYQVVTTNDPSEALNYVKNQEFAAIISDQRMPGMTGLEFFSEVKQIQPDASRILITGVLTLKTVIDAVNKGEIFRFLAKPWIREELLVTIQNAVQRYRLLQSNRKLQSDMLDLNERLAQTNVELQKRMKECLEKENELSRSNAALQYNFKRSIQLCFNIISTFHPTLGKQTKAAVEVCRLMIENSLMDPKDQHTLAISSWLYNIGLISIPREIVDKSRHGWENLSAAEQKLIQNHTKYGQALASFVAELDEVGETIRSHHERWDGSGFPDGLLGKEIPHPARYLAVASYYVEAEQPKEEAIESILEKSGTFFDPEVVQIFLKVTRLVQPPKKIREVTLKELAEGNVLAKDLHTESGLLLVSEGDPIDASTLYKLKDPNLLSDIDSRIFIYE